MLLIKVFHGVNFSEWKKVIYGLLMSVLLGFFLGFFITKLVKIICKKMDRRVTNRFFKKGQAVGGALMAFMHGAQDGQKFMGIFLLGVILSSSGALDSNMGLPGWLIILCFISMCFGVSIRRI